ncbi:ribokinase (plasmid) [Skermanella rosea]|uniref:ribokinase n=1 Tax=Skermanella rosea TaxID=1817965 RepID=UPI001932033B|nr:ribokinase [Skermanella rosea]UEM07400.1 ribokinase [Skermanella rosea]
MHEPVLLSLGSINADFEVRVDEPLAEGLTLMAHDFARVGGGKAANVALLAHRLGHRAVLIGRVGDDDLREQALAPLRQAGIDLRHVSTAPRTATAVSMITVPPDGKKSIVLAPNANDRWDDAAVRDAVGAIAAAPEGSVLAVDYEVPADVVRAATEAAASRGLRIVLDPSSADRVEADVLARVHAIAPNAKEAEQLTGIAVDGSDAARRAASRLADRGIAVVCVKMADGGCVLAHDRRFTLVPAADMEVVDSTGAGDAFTGGLAVALLENKDPVEAACMAVAASGLAVTGYRSQESYPDRERLDRLLPMIADGVQACAGA